MRYAIVEVLSVLFCVCLRLFLSSLPLFTLLTKLNWQYISLFLFSLFRLWSFISVHCSVCSPFSTVFRHRITNNNLIVALVILSISFRSCEVHVKRTVYWVLVSPQEGWENSRQCHKTWSKRRRCRRQPVVGIPAVCVRLSLCQKAVLCCVSGLLILYVSHRLILCLTNACVVALLCTSCAFTSILYQDCLTGFHLHLALKWASTVLMTHT